MQCNAGRRIEKGSKAERETCTIIHAGTRGKAEESPKRLKISELEEQGANGRNGGRKKVVAKTLPSAPRATGQVWICILGQGWMPRLERGGRRGSCRGRCSVLRLIWR